MCKYRTFIAIVFVCLELMRITPAVGQDLVSAETRAICLKSKNTLQATDVQNDMVIARKLNRCDAKSYYYGFDQKPDFVKARQCALLNKDYSILTMIYANGQGVARNWDQAIYFACQAGFAPAEVQDRVEHLTELKHKNSHATDFDFCDDVTSGYMMGQCAAIQERLQQANRQQQLQKIMANWNETDKKSFAKLKQAAEQFFNQRVENEVDLSGTGRAAFQIEERDSLENQLIASLQKINAGQLPNFTESQFQAKDLELNKIYRQIQAQKDFTAGTVTPSGIKKTQQAWLKYRDAWVEYGTTKYPDIKAESWQAWLTAQRIEMLKEYVEN